MSSDVDIGLSHIALPVTDLAVSIDFYRKFANLEVVHHREPASGHSVAWLSDLTRPFVVVLLQNQNGAANGRLGGWAHLGVACLSRDEVDTRLGDAACAGFEIIGPIDDGHPVGYWGIIVDPDGHNLELSHGQQVNQAVAQLAEIPA